MSDEAFYKQYVVEKSKLDSEYYESRNQKEKDLAKAQKDAIVEDINRTKTRNTEISKLHTQALIEDKARQTKQIADVEKAHTQALIEDVRREKSKVTEIDKLHTQALAEDKKRETEKLNFMKQMQTEAIAMDKELSRNRKIHNDEARRERENSYKELYGLAKKGTPDQRDPSPAQVSALGQRYTTYTSKYGETVGRQVFLKEADIANAKELVKSYDAFLKQASGKFPERKLG